jgi:formylglycine-generating enzyme required for sulfatase activity
MDARISLQEQPAAGRAQSLPAFRATFLVLLAAGAVLFAANILVRRGSVSEEFHPLRPAAFVQRGGQLALLREDSMVRIPAGSFLMGSPGAESPDAWPQHRVAIETFWLDVTPVTNAQFREFIESSGYTTTAEQRGRSLVFDVRLRAWQSLAGADWRRPHGPDSSIAGRESWPVVQVSWFDAMAYARWAGKRLPTEAEYEYAGRGGLVDCRFPWGRELIGDGTYWTNSWQGRFPHFDLTRDAFAGISPVDAFPENRYGLADMLGNVYGWCADWYEADYYGHSPRENPAGPAAGEQKVQRGGSWLSTENHEPLAIWHRRAADPTESTNHTGFRCARD